MPAFDNVPNDEAFESLGCKVYPAKMGGSAVGYAIESVATGFGGPVKIMVGFLPDGTIQDISVLSHSETPEGFPHRSCLSTSQVPPRS